MTLRIQFSDPAGPFGAFSNAAEFPFEVDGLVWPTVEHYFQAQKFHQRRLAERIRRARSADEARRLGRSRGAPLRRDWQRVRDQVMWHGIIHKCAYNEEIFDLLLATGDAYIQNVSQTEHYWASAPDGSGRNRLGELLMRLRNPRRDLGI